MCPIITTQWLATTNSAGTGLHQYQDNKNLCVSLSLQLTERTNEIETAMTTAVEESGGAHNGLEGTIMSRKIYIALSYIKFVNLR